MAGWSRRWSSCSAPGRAKSASSPTRCRNVPGAGADAPETMQRESDRWVSIALSVLLHGAILAALVYGWLLYRQPPRPAPTLAIEATVVDSHAARGALVPPPQPAPPPPAVEPPAEPVGPPEPTPEELAAREQQRKQEQAAADEQRRVAEQKA